MDFNHKKMWPTVAASLVAVTSVLSADNGKMNNNSMSDQDREKYGLMNPSVRPKQGNQHWWVVGDLLVWQPHSDGFEYVVDDAIYSSNIITQGQIQNPHFSWDAGFRIGAGYGFGHDGWDLGVKWTWFQSTSRHGDDNCCQDNTDETVILIASDLVAADGGTNPDITASTYHNKYRLHLNLLDIELAREFMTSKWLYLRPHVGARGAWINQTSKNHYATVVASSTYAFDDYEWGNKFKGGGVRGGLDSQWNMGAGFSFYGNLALSLIYGRFNVEMEEETRTSSTSVPTTRLDVEEHFNSVKGIADVAFGLRWGHQFVDHQYNFAVSLGYEEHLFFNQTQIWAILKSSNLDLFNKRSGDLSTQGVTLSFMFDF